MLAHAVPRIDHGYPRDGGGALGRAHLVVAQHDHVRVGVHDADGVFQRLTLGDGRELGGVFRGNHAAAQAMHGGLKRKTGARRGFVKQRRHDALLIVEDAAFGHHALHLLGDLKELRQSSRIELLRFDDVMQLHGRLGPSSSAIRTMVAHSSGKGLSEPDGWRDVETAP